MKKIMIGCLIMMTLSVQAQNGYWQQYLRFAISVQLDPKTKSFTANETIVYKNNSPQALTFIWFHLYPNAYKNNSTALFRQLANDNQRKDRFPSHKDGFITGLNFTVNGEAATTEPYPDKNTIDIVKLILPHTLQPGDSITIATPFTVQLPSYFSRSGFSDSEFIVCQWYPKPAMFDKNGWHEMPYLDMGEFYSEYATYDVKITVPSNYVVAATGMLQNADELAAYKASGAYNTANPNSEPKRYQPITTEATKELVYHVDSVPDFAWFADPSFIVEYDTLQLGSQVIGAFTYHYNKPNTQWRNSTAYVKDAVHHYSRWIGAYDYPLVQAVEGPKNNVAGGMEYPTITLITAPDAKPETLDNMITHEVGHNWFMSMLGTNERDHAWMDEGLNSYYEFRYMAEKYRSNLILGSMIPDEMKKMDEASFQYAVYNALMQIPVNYAIETPAAAFTGSQDYAITEYVKTAEWMFLLENSVGEEKVDAAFQHYFSLWKNKHPQPEDCKAAFEEAIGGSLSSFFSLLNKTGKLSEK